MDALNPIVDFFFPEKCSSCQKENIKLSQPLCNSCLKKIEFTNSKKRCDKCGDPLISKSCSCQDRHFFFKNFFSIWLYDKQGRSLLKQAKFNERTSAIRYLKKNIPSEIWEMLETLENSAMLILPSSHNYLERMANFLAYESGIPIYKVFYKKIKNLQSKLMHERERFLQIENNLRIDPKKFANVIKKKYSHFLLVDDIWTSGATMNFAAKLLTEEGINSESIITLGMFRRDKRV